MISFGSYGKTFVDLRFQSFDAITFFKSLNFYRKTYKINFFISENMFNLSEF